MKNAIQILCLLGIIISLQSPLLSQNAFWGAKYLASIPEEVWQGLQADKNSGSKEDLSFFKRQLEDKELELKEAKTKADSSDIEEQISGINKNIDDIEEKMDAKPQSSVLSNAAKFMGTPFGEDIQPIDLKTLQAALKAEKSAQGLGYLGAAAIIAPILTTLASSSGRIDPAQQSILIDALATYMAEEFRKGQAMTYMLIFKETLGKIGELQVLLPETYERLRTADPLRFPELGQDLRETFRKDLDGIVPALIQHIQSPQAGLAYTVLDESRCQGIRSKAAWPPIAAATDAAARLATGLHPAEVLQYLDQSHYPKANQDHWKGTAHLIHLANILQQNLRDTARTGQAWISLSQFASLSPREAELFAGLIYQQDKAFFKQYIPQDALDKADTIKAWVQHQLVLLAQIDATITQYKDELLLKGSPRLAAILLDILEKANADLNLPPFDPERLRILRLATEGALAILGQDHANTIRNATALIDYLLQQADVATNDPKLVLLLNTLGKYGEFMEAVANAEDKDEMKTVLRSFVAPPASFIEKRNNPFSISISGHPGYFLGGEIYREKDAGAGFNSGITAPIGLEFNWGLLGQEDKDGKPLRAADLQSKGSIGIFVQAFDLGAVMNFRLSDSSSVLPDTLTFRQLLSPGISFNYGFPRSMATLGLGYQYTPELRTVTVDGVDLRSQGHRIFLRISIDLPLVNIYRKRYDRWKG